MLTVFINPADAFQIHSVGPAERWDDEQEKKKWLKEKQASLPSRLIVSRLRPEGCKTHAAAPFQNDRSRQRQEFQAAEGKGIH